MTGDDIFDHLKELQLLLSEANSTPRVSSSRMASSSFYDSTYNFTLISMILHIAGKEVDEGGNKLMTINLAMLKFYAFCIVRPYLLEQIDQWKNKPQQASFFDFASSTQLPHGFLVDSNISDAILFLVSTGNLGRYGRESGSVSLTVAPAALLNKLYNKMIEKKLLSAEMATLNKLHSFKIKLTDLGLA